MALAGSAADMGDAVGVGVVGDDVVGVFVGVSVGVAVMGMHSSPIAKHISPEGQGRFRGQGTACGSVLQEVFAWSHPLFGDVREKIEVSVVHKTWEFG